MRLPIYLLSALLTLGFTFHCGGGDESEEKTEDAVDENGQKGELTDETFSAILKSAQSELAKTPLSEIYNFETLEVQDQNVKKIFIESAKKYEIEEQAWTEYLNANEAKEKLRVEAVETTMKGVYEDSLIKLNTTLEEKINKLEETGILESMIEKARANPDNSEPIADFINQAYAEAGLKKEFVAYQLDKFPKLKDKFTKILEPFQTVGETLKQAVGSDIEIEIETEDNSTADPGLAETTSTNENPAAVGDSRRISASPVPGVGSEGDDTFSDDAGSEITDSLMEERKRLLNSQGGE